MVSDAYNRVRKIKFKKKDSNKVDPENEEINKNYFPNNRINKIDNKEENNILRRKGEGRIVSSNITVKGFHTKFQQELKVGDILEIQHPNTLISESREIIDIISERTLILDKEFSSDLVSTCEYYYIRKEDDINKYSENMETFSYREKDGKFKYKTIVEYTDKKLSREDILDIRVKKQRDKYCWT